VKSTLPAFLLPRPVLRERVGVRALLVVIKKALTLTLSPGVPGEGTREPGVEED